MRALGAGIAAAALLAAMPAVAGSESIQRGGLRVSFDAQLSPHALPRHRPAPVKARFSGRITTADGQVPPQLRKVVLRLNRHGRIESAGLPRCNYHQIQPSSTADAERICGASLVGRGTFKANVALPDQSPYPSNGTILAFNGNLHGRPVIYLHIYGTEPLPTSNILPFELRREGGKFGTKLVAKLPQVAAEWGFVSGISLTLQRNFSHGGKKRSYLSASCPAPKGVRAASYSLAEVSFGFDDGRTLSSMLTRSCGARR